MRRSASVWRKSVRRRRRNEKRFDRRTRSSASRPTRWVWHATGHMTSPYIASSCTCTVSGCYPKPLSCLQSVFTPHILQCGNDVNEFGNTLLRILIPLPYHYPFRYQHNPSNSYTNTTHPISIPTAQDIPFPYQHNPIPILIPSRPIHPMHLHFIWRLYRNWGLLTVVPCSLDEVGKMAEPLSPLPSPPAIRPPQRSAAAVCHRDPPGPSPHQGPHQRDLGGGGLRPAAQPPQTPGREVPHREGGRKQ